MESFIFASHFLIMRITIAANNDQKLAFETKGIADGAIITWVKTSQALYEQTGADALIDCLFDGNTNISTTKPLLINACHVTLAQLNLHGPVARFCCWNGFIERPLWEMAVAENTDPQWLQNLMAATGWAFELVQDQPGLIAPRVISTIVNEAFFALQENISTKKEIDTAMKLGTNYPLGPFEWSDKLGLVNIYTLLTILSGEDKRYLPCEEMKKQLYQTT